MSYSLQRIAALELKESVAKTAELEAPVTGGPLFQNFSALLRDQHFIHQIQKLSKSETQIKVTLTHRKIVVWDAHRTQIASFSLVDKQSTQKIVSDIFKTAINCLQKSPTPVERTSTPISLSPTNTSPLPAREPEKTPSPVFSGKIPSPPQSPPSTSPKSVKTASPLLSPRKNRLPPPAPTSTAVVSVSPILVKTGSSLSLIRKDSSTPPQSPTSTTAFRATPELVKIESPLPSPRPIPSTPPPLTLEESTEFSASPEPQKDVEEQSLTASSSRSISPISLENPLTLPTETYPQFRQQSPEPVKTSTNVVSLPLSPRQQVSTASQPIELRGSSPSPVLSLKRSSTPPMSPKGTSKPAQKPKTPKKAKTPTKARQEAPNPQKRSWLGALMSVFQVDPGTESFFEDKPEFFEENSDTQLF